MTTSPVERRTLGAALSISRVIIGLWQVADMERDGRLLDTDTASAAMEPYVAAGMTTFDMADHYGSAELIAGWFRTAHAHRGDVQLLTKWVPKPGPVTRDDVRTAVQRALDRLNADRIDLLQFHAWRFADAVWLDALTWLQELKGEGLVGELGMTNCDTADLRVAVASGIEIVSNQVCSSIIDRRASGRMAEFCAAHDIAILAYGTLAGGFLTERWLGAPEPAAGELATWSLMKYKRFIDAPGGWAAFQRLLVATSVVANRMGVPMATVAMAMRHALDQPAVAAVIVGARMGERVHRADSLHLFEIEIDAKSRALLDDAIDSLTPIPGDGGDEYREPPYLTATGDPGDHLDAFPPPYPVRVGDDDRRRALSGTGWEDLAGFCRAVRVGNRIVISGTTALHGDRCIGGTDAAAPVHFAIDKVEGAFISLGARLRDVVRTRLFVARLDDWEAVARAHGERFAGIQPANTLVQAGIVGNEYLVEVEAEAEVS